MSSPPRPPSYPGGMYYPATIEGVLTRRTVFALNALALLMIYIAVLVRLASGDLNARGFAHVLVTTGGILGAFGSLMGALGSKRTSDMQNLGLFVWAGLLLLVSMQVFLWI